MDDQFLYQLSEQPDAEFVDELRRKLSRYGRVEQNQASKVTHFRFSGLLGVMAVLVLILLFGAASISPVRAFVESLIERFGGQSFELTENYPGDDHWGVEEIIEPRQMPLDEALVVFPYSVKLPMNIPDGYVVNEQDVRVYVGKEAGPFANSIEIAWGGGLGMRYYSLRITDTDYASVSEIVGPGSVEEIILANGHPAVLIRGGWDADDKVWNPAVGLRLRWSAGGLYYELQGQDLEVMKWMALSTME